MGRPNVIKEPTRTYTLLIAKEDWRKLYSISVDKSKESGKHVSVAHLLREGAKNIIRRNR